MLDEVHEADMVTLESSIETLRTVGRRERDCRDKAEADITAMKEKFNQKCLEADELRLQLKVFQEQLSQAFMTAENEHARRADLEKAHSDLQSELANVSTVFYYYLILNYQI
jgi:DNA-binding protein H-NS